MIGWIEIEFMVDITALERILTSCPTHIRRPQHILTHADIKLQKTTAEEAQR